MSRPADNQWPRYQVFHQPRPDKPHLNAGSVHAPDAELALQNARDVFVRRPECSSLWVVRADFISSMTKEQFEGGGLLELTDGSEKPEPRRLSSQSGPTGQTEELQPYLVFQKRNHSGSHEHTGEVEARSAAEALNLAAKHGSEQPVLVWWVVPKRLVAASEPDQSESMFEPARGKDYRGQAAYPTTTMMRKVRQQDGE